MSKLLGFSFVLIVATLGVAIASLVFGILTWNQVNTPAVIDPATPTGSPLPDITTAPSVPNPTTKSVDPDTTRRSTGITSAPPTPDKCPTKEEVSDDPQWKAAANRLLAIADLSADPCDDFYQFACGKYLQNTDLEGQARKSTFDETQYTINIDLANYFDNKDTKMMGNTEKYQKNFYDICVADGLKDPSDPAVRKAKWTDLTLDLNQFLGFPLMGVAKVPKDVGEIFTTMGQMERLYTGGPLITSFVTADFKDNTKNALYLNQPALHYARDYFVKPQFINKLQDYASDITDLLVAYSTNMNLQLDPKFCPGLNADGVAKTQRECARQVAEWAVNFERSLAMSSWPGDELRNYKQQYNPFPSLAVLDAYFKDLYLGNYVRGLMQMKKDDEIAGYKVVLSELPYFAALEGQFEAGHISQDDYVNYLAIHFLMDNADEYGIDIPSADRAKNAKLKTHRRDTEPKFHRYITRRGTGARRISRKPLNSRGIAANENDAVRTGCIDTLIDYMPFGPGYTYVKNRDDKYDVRADAQAMTENIIAQFGNMLNSLDWIDAPSLARAHAKSTSLVRNYLWPEFFGDFKNTDSIDDHNHRYADLLQPQGMTMWAALKTLKFGLQTTEQFDIVDKAGDRTNFLSSPATVNAWYQPERNSITLPFGILNPPFYDLSYPQAYNYGGQGGVAGHELTHGYDDEGTQFDEVGMLADCEFTHCSILDDNSRSGFVDMAQCVVRQFDTQCCPLKTGNVRCVNGDTTQGENIADLGGQQATYRAYGQRGAPELRLPGLEQFTPNQIFWMTYGGTWCMKITDDRLLRQLMTDVHSPSSCRVNQVMQDIPQFGQDFGCKRGASKMYPDDADRCKVWVGF